MSLEGHLNSLAVHTRPTVTYDTAREASRTWATLDSALRIAVFPRGAMTSTERDFGLKLDYDAVAYVEASADVRPEQADGARDRLQVSLYTYDVVAVRNAGMRGKHKKLALKLQG